MVSRAWERGDREQLLIRTVFSLGSGQRYWWKCSRIRQRDSHVTLRLYQQPLNCMLKKKKTDCYLLWRKKKRISEIFVLFPLFVVCFWYFSVALPLLPFKWPDNDDILFTISYLQNADGVAADDYHKATF